MNKNNETSNNSKPMAYDALLGVVNSDKWKFCNTKLEPFPHPWSSEYKCPKCGNHLVNILGTCATKVYY